jgi:hypothetical protein
VLSTVEALISRGYVTDSTKRPNPQKRKKIKNGRLGVGVGPPS